MVDAAFPRAACPHRQLEVSTVQEQSKYLGTQDLLASSEATVAPVFCLVMWSQEEVHQNSWYISTLHHTTPPEQLVIHHTVFNRTVPQVYPLHILYTARHHMQYTEHID